MPVLMNGPRGIPVAVLTLARKPCDRCGRRVRFTLLPKYHDRSGKRWCLRCVRLRPSPSRDWYAAGQRVAADMVRGIEQAEARRAELLASGMTPEEAQAVMVREMVSDPGFAVMLAHAEGVVRRSFGALYEDEEGKPEE